MLNSKGSLLTREGTYFDDIRGTEKRIADRGLTSKCKLIKSAYFRQRQGNYNKSMNKTRP